MLGGSQPAKVPRKSVRSTSPRAVELRRLQNRLSQRSRLRQARETAHGDSDIVSGLQSPTTPARNPLDSSEHALAESNASAADTINLMVTQSLSTPLTADTMTLAEDLLQYDTPWHHIDSMMNIRSPDYDIRTPQSSLTPSNTTPPSTSSLNCTCNNMAGPCSYHVKEMRAQILAETNELHTPSSIADDITPRFGIVLEAIRQAGFQDIEEMVLAYYTSRFERGSVPAMLQCASRKRRLKTMLQELQRESGQWPRWESRGLNEGVSEAAVSLCVEEMERLARRLPKLNRPAHNETANLVSALEWSLRDQGCDVQNYVSPRDGESLDEVVENAPDSVDATSLVLAHGVDRETELVL